MKTDVLIIGAGAAGLMCASIAGKRGRSVCLVDHATRLAEKIRISGGGRCNFTNLYAAPENYLCENPHFVRSALARYGPHDFLKRVDYHGIRWHEKKLGQLFCDGSSQQIIDMLQGECLDAGVDLRLGVQVTHVAHEGDYRVTTASGETISAEALVVATGGLSIPKIGASGFGYDLARQFGHHVRPLRPGLVPLTLHVEDLARLGDLSGVAVDAEATAEGPAFRENILFTHKGLSGPAVLQASSYWQPGAGVQVNLLPGLSAVDLLEAHRRGGHTAEAVLTRHLPKRLAATLAREYLPAGRIADWTDAQRRQAAALLHAWTLYPNGSEGYRKAEVTLGGVDTRELSSKTMESALQRGLYFIGEVVSVTGWLGGYNFQFAWSSAFAAGSHV